MIWNVVTRLLPRCTIYSMWTPLTYRIVHPSAVQLNFATRSVGHHRCSFCAPCALLSIAGVVRCSASELAATILFPSWACVGFVYLVDNFAPVRPRPLKLEPNSFHPRLFVRRRSSCECPYISGRKKCPWILWRVKILNYSLEKRSPAYSTHRTKFRLILI